MAIATEFDGIRVWVTNNIVDRIRVELMYSYTHLDVGNVSTHSYWKLTSEYLFNCSIRYGLLRIISRSAQVEYVECLGIYGKYHTLKDINHRKKATANKVIRGILVALCLRYRLPLFQAKIRQVYISCLTCKQLNITVRYCPWGRICCGLIMVLY